MSVGNKNKNKICWVFFYNPQIPEVNPADTERLEWIPCRNKRPAEHTSVMGGGAELTVTSAQLEGPGSVQGQGSSCLIVTVDRGANRKRRRGISLSIVSFTLSGSERSGL